MKKRLALIILSLITGLFWKFSTAVSAQQTLEGTLTVEPIFQNISIDESQSSVPFTITVHNQTNEQQKVDVFALDFQQIDEQGNITFVDKASHNYQLASYISIPEKDITIEANQTASISAFIQNNVSLTPGGHYAALIVRHQQPKIENQQQILMGLSSLVFLHKKGGERYNLSLSDYSLSDTFFTFQMPEKISLSFSNEGNVQLIPTGKAEILDMFGRVVFEGLINDGSRFILPESKKTFLSSLEPRQKLLPFSILTITISGNNSLNTTPFQQQNVMIYISQWILFPVMIIPVGIIAFLIILRKRKRNLS